jgi:uncharacterized protein
MAEDLLEKYPIQLLESHQAPEVDVAWQGGEPTLMGLQFFQRSVAAVNSSFGLSTLRPTRKLSFSQVNKGGAGSFDQGMLGLNFLKTHHVDFNILCTVHAANQQHPLQVYRFFRDGLDAQFIQFIPIVERVSASMLPVANLGWSQRPGGDRPLYKIEGNQMTKRSVGAQKYGKFLISIFDAWLKTDVGNVYVQHFDSPWPSGWVYRKRSAFSRPASSFAQLDLLRPAPAMAVLGVIKERDKIWLQNNQTSSFCGATISVCGTSAITVTA